MSHTDRPQPDLPRQAWSQPIRHIDASAITIVPVVKHQNPHEATSRYADLYWTPSIGAPAIALLRWASHQIRPMTMTEIELGTAIGAPGKGQVRRSIDALVKHDLATITAGNTLHIAITLPKLSVLQARRFGETFANRHHHEAAPKRRLGSRNSHA